MRTLAAAAAAPTGDAPQAVRAGLLEVDAADLGGDLLEECFGPVTVLVRYRDAADAEAVLSSLGGNLTATLHAEAAEPGAAAWLARLSRFAGRVIFGGWPTGVAVAPAMTHGGPYPATTTPTTSVGGTAIDRWLRPVTFQTVPAGAAAAGAGQAALTARRPLRADDGWPRHGWPAIVSSASALAEAAQVAGRQR